MKTSVSPARLAVLPLALSGVFAAAFPSLAQTVAPVQVAALGETVVTATRTPTRTDELVSEVVVVTREQIETSTARTVPELLARLRALLRRSQAATSATLSFGPLELDTALRQANIRNSDGVSQPIELGPREWTVMEYLMLQAPKPANKDKLLQALTGWDKEITPNAVEVYISRLRGKLEPHGLALRSIRGFGYRLELLEPPAAAVHTPATPAV